jgi:hypothetical protein
VKHILRRRPSPALVISCIALFVSLGGVSYGVATGFIDSREIRNNTIRSGDVRNNTLRTFDIRNNEVRGFDIRNSSIQGRDVAFNTLTGVDVAEASLGEVPKATSATDATTVGGMSVQKISAKQPVGTGATAIYSNAYFTLEASCTATDAVLRLNGVAGAPETSAAWQQSDDTAAPVPFDSDGDLNPGDNDALLSGTAERGVIQLEVSTTDNRVTTLSLSAQDSPAFLGENVCAFRGTAVSG